jgi:HEAT repeat protein
MSSPFLNQILTVSGLHSEHQGEYADFYALLKALSADSSVSDSAATAASELFTVRIPAIGLPAGNDCVRRLREFLSQRCFTDKIGQVPIYRA